MLLPSLTTDQLCAEARDFIQIDSHLADATLYGVTDGKKIGTYFEHELHAHLRKKYLYAYGSSAKGIDFPELGVDMKVTSIRQPQSSCPFQSARQKIYGLGYSLLIFVYDKTDDPATMMGKLTMLHIIFVDAENTADYQTTAGIRQILQNDGNTDDLVAFMRDRFLPVDEVQAFQLAEEILRNAPQQGYLTISNALQWRLQYQRVINSAGTIEGIHWIYQGHDQTA
jgi:hypothetical protein